MWVRIYFLYASYYFFSFPFPTCTTSPQFLYEAACSDMGLLMTAHRSNSRSSSFFLVASWLPCSLASSPRAVHAHSAQLPLSQKNSSNAYSHFFFGGGSFCSGSARPSLLLKAPHTISYKHAQLYVAKKKEREREKENRLLSQARK